MLRPLLSLGLCAVSCGLLAGCSSSSKQSTSPAAAGGKNSPAFAVAIEGACPKLRAHTVGENTVLVVGTYGLDEAGAWTGRQTARAAQAIAIVHGPAPKEPLAGAQTAEIKPTLLEGLPRTDKGWIEGDVEVGGAFPNGVWLERTLRTPAKLNQGALFETTHDGFTWNGNTWRSSAGRDAVTRGPHTTLPTAQLFCSEAAGGDENVALSLLAAERAPDGTTFVAGRCEDELHRPTGPMLLGRYDVRSHRWQKMTAPNSVLFEGPDAIVNAGIIAVSADEAWIYAYRPFSEKEAQKPYLIHIDIGASSPLTIDIPFDKSITSLARTPTGSLWAIAGFSELRHWDVETRRWDAAPIAMPPLKFVEPIPSNVRLLDVQATKRDVWVHGAVPIVKEDGSPGREHVLYTTAQWAQPLHCDREREPQQALTSTATKKVKLGVLPKRIPNKDGT
jgi:hypothetical protein